MVKVIKHYMSVSQEQDIKLDISSTHTHTQSCISIIVRTSVDIMRHPVPYLETQSVPRDLLTLTPLQNLTFI